MNKDYNLYYTFYVVAKYKNITRAAEHLYISQPAVTQSIKTLENNLGATLFIRTKKGVTLTEEAEILYKYVEEGFTFIENGEKKFKELKNLMNGTLKIGASTTVTENIILPIIEKYKEKYTNISISINNNLTEELIKLLKNGTVDILVLNLPTIEHKDIEIIPFMEVNDSFVVGKKLKDLTLQSTSIKNLLNYDFIFQKSPSNTRTYLNNFLKIKNINLNPKYEVVSFSLVKNMTKSGLGIGYLTKEFIESELKNKELFLLKTKENIPSRKIGIAYLKNSIPSFASRAFIEIILKDIKK